MNLLDVVDRLGEFDDDASIFAERVKGTLLPESTAAVILLTEYESDLPLNEVTARRCPGMEYVVDVTIARSIVEKIQTAGRTPQQAANAIINYVGNRR